MAGSRQLPASGKTRVVITRASGVLVNVFDSSDTESCFIETKDLDMGRQDVLKFLRRLISDISFSTVGGLDNLELLIRGRTNKSQEFIDSDPISLAGGAIDLPVRVPNSRFFRLRYTDKKIKERWKLTKLEMFGSPAGRRW